MKNLVFIIGMCLIFSSCGMIATEPPNSETAQIVVDAGEYNPEAVCVPEGVAEKECAVCSVNPEVTGSRQNIGIVFANTGQLIEIPLYRAGSPALSMDTVRIGKNGTFHMSANDQLHHADIKLTLTKENLLSMEQAKEHFCSACLEQLKNAVNGFDFAVVDFQTMKIYPAADEVFSVAGYLLHSVQTVDMDGKKISQDITVLQIPSDG